MSRQHLIQQIRQKQSFLCVGLDTDSGRIPPALQGKKEPVLAFNRAIIEATKDLCVAYKINTAFYEVMGAKGWDLLEKTVAAIPPDCLTIADAKRGDIGNTSHRYARAFFEKLDFDAITVNPYMGHDSVIPFLEYPDKWVIVLGLTSNAGSHDFQMLPLARSGKHLYEQVMETAASWGHPGNMMFVAGATQAETFQRIRQLLPEHFLLVPGIGVQGGSMDDVMAYGMTEDIGLLVNASRSIIYAGDGADFDQKAREAAQKLQQTMQQAMAQKRVAK